jgi:hypothetical protein
MYHVVPVAAVTVSLALSFAVLIGPFDHVLGRHGRVQGAQVRFAIDADTTNGICTTIDSTGTVTAGESYQVAICVENLPQEIDAFDLHVTYDDTLNYAPELPDQFPALDDNPDANAGVTTFSSPDIGPDWDCSGLGHYFPIGDDNPSSGPGKGTAFITCDHYYGGSYHLAGKSLPLAVIAFQALSPGADSFNFHDLDKLAWESRTVAMCDPDSAWTMPCDGATVTILPEPTSTPTPTATHTPSPSPTPTPTATATPEPPPDGDGGGAPDFLELAVGGNPSDPADDAAILAADSDGDGCANGEELGGAAAPAPGSTGAYDPLAAHDFYDVPVPANPDPAPNGSSDRAVNLSDVLAVLFYAGASDNGKPNANGADYDSLKDGDTNGDTQITELDEAGRRYDRTASPAPNPPFDAGPSNGAVNLADVLAVLAQVGLDCNGPP